MTLSGTVNKSGILLLMLLATAYYSWITPQYASILSIGGAIGGFIVAMIIVFKKTLAPVLAPVYAALEGLFLGAVSMYFEMRFPGVVLQSVGLTFGVFAALLIAYQSGLIKATENFKLGIAAATGGIFLFYLVGMVLSFFGIHTVSGLHSVENTSMLSIGISLVVVVVAALNLVLDFDFIENGVERQAPKFMEWYAAFGLLVTLVWLYLEMLRLVAKLQSRD